MKRTEMSKIILTLKGILLYTTMIAAMLFITGVDIIYDNGYFVEGVLIVAAMIYTCYKTINEKELNILTLNKYFKMPDEEDEW